MTTTHLDRGTLRAAIALANRAPSVHNSQPWIWRIGDSSIHLFADADRALPATDPDARDLRISCGAALHHLRVALRAAGLDTRVHRLPDPAAPHHLAALMPVNRRPDADDLALAAAIERRRTDRRVFSSWPVPMALLADLAGAAAAETGILQFLLDDTQRWTVTRLLERAAVEQALTPGTAQETAAWTGRSRTSADGVPAAAVPADPTGTVPVRHFRTGELRQAGLGIDETDGTVVALLATRGDGPIDQVRAGEALSAVLLAATRIGLATDPISQLLEVAGTREELRTSCLPAGEPQMLLRLGWAPVSADPLPATGRRPVDETIRDLDRPWH